MMKIYNNGNTKTDELIEKKYVFDKFNANDALTIGTNIANKALKEDVRLTVKIIFGNKTLYHFSTDKSTPDTENWIEKKLNTVMHFHTSTKLQLEKNMGDETLLATKYGLNLSHYTLTPGGFPIRLKNVGVVGAIAVSGLDALDDHEYILKALDLIYKFV